jgi:type II secretory pathway predicted ATPase ExeA
MRLSTGLAVPPPHPASATPQVRDPSPLPIARSYLDLYGLASPPFIDGPEGAEFQFFGSRRSALEHLLAGMLRDRGHLLLTGEEGIGKTAILNQALRLASAEPVEVIRLECRGRGPRSLDDLLGQLPVPDPLAGRPAEAMAFLSRHAQDGSHIVLAVDDAHNLGPDALAFLAELSSKPERIRIVLVGRPALRPLVQSPDHPGLAERITNTLRLGPLTIAEAQQYIEKRLWIAGSSVRRLISPAAIRDVVRRGGGVPGEINLILEQILNAGFLRGDPLLTPRTIQAALGAPPRARRRADPAESHFGRYVTAAAGLVLLAGVGAFVWSAMETRPAQPNPAALSAAATPMAPNPADPATRPIAPAPEPPRTDLPPELVTLLVQRGNAMIASGDLAAARLLYQRAAEAGNAAAAISLAQTYDPAYLARYGATGIQPDAALAKEWYRRAEALRTAASEASKHPQDLKGGKPR